MPAKKSLIFIEKKARNIFVVQKNAIPLSTLSGNNTVVTEMRDDP